MKGTVVAHPELSALNTDPGFLSCLDTYLCDLWQDLAPSKKDFPKTTSEQIIYLEKSLDRYNVQLKQFIDYDSYYMQASANKKIYNHEGCEKDLKNSLASKPDLFDKLFDETLIHKFTKRDVLQLETYGLKSKDNHKYLGGRSLLEYMSGGYRGNKHKQELLYQGFKKNGVRAFLSALVETHGSPLMKLLMLPGFGDFSLKRQFYYRKISLYSWNYALNPWAYDTRIAIARRLLTKLTKQLVTYVEVRKANLKGRLSKGENINFDSLPKYIESYKRLASAINPGSAKKALESIANIAEEGVDATKNKDVNWVSNFYYFSSMDCHRSIRNTTITLTQLGFFRNARDTSNNAPQISPETYYEWDEKSRAANRAAEGSNRAAGEAGSESSRINEGFKIFNTSTGRTEIELTIHSHPRRNNSMPHSPPSRSRREGNTETLKKFEGKENHPEQEATKPELTPHQAQTQGGPGQ